VAIADRAGMAGLNDMPAKPPRSIFPEPFVVASLAIRAVPARPTGATRAGRLQAIPRLPNPGLGPALPVRPVGRWMEPVVEARPVLLPALGLRDCLNTGAFVRKRINVGAAAASIVLFAAGAPSRRL